jgi:hypothetical protein
MSPGGRNSVACEDGVLGVLLDGLPPPDDPPPDGADVPVVVDWVGVVLGLEPELQPAARAARATSAAALEAVVIRMNPT